jgi:broad specificity phosphatase PhoE
LAFSQDKKFKIPKEDASQYFGTEFGGTASASAVSASSFKSKQIIFIRHGESTWNDTFNPGGRNIIVFILLYIPNMIKALVTEWYFFISGKESESWFFDSALSTKGVRQIEALRKFLRKEKMRLGSGNFMDEREELAVKYLLNVNNNNGGGGGGGGGNSSSSSMVVSSNLRRAISTAAIGLSDRFALQHKDDDILLLDSLQEISFNPDALSILPPHGTAHPTWCDTNIPGVPVDKFSKLIDTQYHSGNKALNSTGLIRLNQFVADIFSPKCDKDVIIAVGHSLFFRSFFQMFLPRSVEHVSKKKKLVNGGTVMLTLGEVMLTDGTKVYMIDPNSVVVVYGGFGKHHKK